MTALLPFWIFAVPLVLVAAAIVHQAHQRMSQNDFTSLSERHTAREFVRAMRVAGATVLG